jgi:zinc transport system substrate-binding protein
MKRWLFGAVIGAVLMLCCACSAPDLQPNIAATTLPVYTFTDALCKDTSLTVGLLVQENISCLHDYSLTVKHMMMLEHADLIVISGGGLEDFLTDALPKDKQIIDASLEINMHHTDDHHDHNDTHHHEFDPHFWLSIENAKHMAHTICDGLSNAYPHYRDIFASNLHQLDQKFDALLDYAKTHLAQLSCRELITFHDGFSYMAEEFGLNILHSMEEESGSEASARDLIEITNLVTEHDLPAVFVEKNGSNNAANIICSETNADLYILDMALSGSDYFRAMYHNIDTLKEALG